MKRQLYLLKVPSTLLETWDQQKNGGQVIGYLEKAKQNLPSGKSNLKITLGQGDDREYKVKELETGRLASKMVVFSGSSDRKKRDGKCEGEISKVWTATPAQKIKEYSQRLKHKLEERIKAKKSSVTKVTEETVREIRIKQKERERLERHKRRRENQDGPSAKKVRELHVKKSEVEVESMIYDAFGKQAYYTLAQLQGYTDQPKPYLKSFLDRMCNYHRSGEHIHHYSLKPEYNNA